MHLPRSKGTYELKFTGGAVVDIKTIIPKHLKGPLRKQLLEKVATDPLACSCELHGELAGYGSFTWQEYRIVYRIFDDLRAVAIVGAGPRSPQSSENIYRRLERLARTGELAEGVLFSLRGFTEPEP
jgi:mRNA-degrading endonuclease RelE of RelBE toxin-antitoxin system